MMGCSEVLTDDVLLLKWISPVVYQMNVKVILTTLSALHQQKEMTFDDIPNELLNRLSIQGFDFIYLLGVWTTGEGGLEAARGFMRECQPHASQDFISSSPFAIFTHEIDKTLGGAKALARLRSRMAAKGLGLILDFVPNHVAFDHYWSSTIHRDEPHRSMILPGTLDLIRREPQNYYLVVEDENDDNILSPTTICQSRKVLQGVAGLKYLEQNSDELHKRRVMVFAHGRDPMFDGWRDTGQLNYYNPQLRFEVINLLREVSMICDGVRCDMANLIPWVTFNRTWRSRYEESIRNSSSFDHAPEFWEEAIRAVKGSKKNVKFIAEVYWNMEHELMHQGFDFCYDKKLYDCIRHESVDEIKKSLCGNIGYQSKLTRFLENHDESRCASIFRDIRQHEAAAIITYSGLGMKFFHMGQLEGRTAQIPMQIRTYVEKSHHDTQWSDDPQWPTQNAEIYVRLLKSVLSRHVSRNGRYRMADVHPSSHGCQNHRGIISFVRYHTASDRQRIVNSDSYESPLLIVVNYTPKWADGWVSFYTSEMDFGYPDTETTLFNTYNGPMTCGLVMKDLLTPHAVYRKDWNEVQRQGVWFGMKPWQSHVFEFIWR